MQSMVEDELFSSTTPTSECSHALCGGAMDMTSHTSKLGDGASHCSREKNSVDKTVA